ncbi:hypothetical protein ACFLQ3_02860 [Bacteroidota bacterium]
MENKFDLIEQYLMNDMSVREQEEFEELLRNDPDLMKEFVLRKDINDAIQEEDVISLRSNLYEIVNSSKEPQKVNRVFVYSAIAAIIILLITIGSFYFYPFNRNSDRDIFQSYYAPYPAIMSFRSPVDQNELEKILYNAFNYYDDEEFGKASESFQLVLNMDSSNYMSQFYLSICEIEKENLIEAEEYLIDLIHKKEHIFWEQSHWYLALIYLKQKDTVKIENILGKIIIEDMAQKDEAESILKQMN